MGWVFVIITFLLTSLLNKKENMNSTSERNARELLKKLISECTEGQQHLFKRMYSHANLERCTDEIVDNLHSDKLDRVVSQCEITLEKNNSKL